jgi:hypothetical protein
LSWKFDRPLSRKFPVVFSGKTEMKNEPQSNKIGAEDGIAINELSNATDYLK